MNVALKEANDLQKRIDELNDRIDAVELKPVNKQLDEKLDMLRRAYTVLGRDLDKLTSEIDKETRKNLQAKNRTQSVLGSERDTLITARDAVLEHAKNMA